MLFTAPISFSQTRFCSPPEQVFGWSPEVFLRQPALLLTLVHPEDQTQFESVWSQLREGGEAGWTGRLRHADGRHRRYHLEARTVPDPAADTAEVVGCLAEAGPGRATPGLRGALRELLAGFLLGRSSMRRPRASAGAPTPPADASLLYLLVEKSPLAMGIATLTGRMEYLNPALRSVYGDRIANAPSVMEIINAALPNPADRRRAMKHWREEILGRKRKSRPPAPFHCRINARDGWREVVIRTVVVADRVLAIVEDVTELQRAQESLRQKEERLSHALEGASDGLWDWDLRADTVYYSPRWKSMLGYSEDGVKNEFGAWKKLLHPDDRQPVMRVVRDVIAGRVPNFEVEFRLRHLAGHWVDILSRGRVLRDERGRVRRMVGTHVDITASKNTERLLVIQRDLALALAQASDLKAALAALLAAALQMPDFDCGTVYQRDVQQGCLDLVAHHGVSAWLVKKVRHLAADTVEAQIIARGKAFYAVRATLPDPVARNMAREKLESLAAVPIHVEGQVIGTLNVTSRQKPRITLAAQIALENLVRQAEATIALIRVSDMQRETERQLRLAIEGSNLGTWVADLEQGTFLASPLANELHGIAPDHQSTLAERLAVVHPDDRPRVTEIRRRAVESGLSYEMEYRVRLPDGRVRWNVTKARFHLENGRRLMYGICYDNTARKEAEEALRKARDELEQRVADRTRDLRVSEAKYRRLIETMRDGLVIVDMAGRILEFNPAYQEMLGYPEEELRRLTYVDLTPEKWHAFEAGVVTERIIATGYSGLYEKEYRRADGTIFPIELSTVLVRDEQGQPVKMWATVRDITQRKRAEAALQASEQKFRVLFEQAAVGVAQIETATGRFLKVNRRYAEIVGYSVAEMLGRTFQALTHPEDLAGDLANMQRLMAGEIPEFAMEKRYVRRNGSIVWVRLSVSPMWAPGTKPDYHIAVVEDITRRKQAEAELRHLNENLERAVAKRSLELKHSESRFRMLAAASFEGVVISKRGRILDCNEQYAALIGYEVEEVLGREIWDFVPPEEQSLIRKTILKGLDVKVEHIMIHKDGNRRVVEVRGRSPEGVNGLRLSTVRDITERRRADLEMEKLRQNMARFQRLGELSEVSLGVIHQIGQPLSAITANIGAVRHYAAQCKVDCCQARDILTEVDADLKRARETIQRVRALSHPERPQRQPVNLTSLVEDLLRLLRADIEARQIEIQMDLSPNLPPVALDVVQINQTLLNVMRNAFDAVAGCAPGQRRISVSTRSEDHQVTVAISDTGMGLAPEALSHLFEPFFTTKPDGMGVGLRLAQTIVHAHGGTIQGFNNPGQPGATFCITLPLKETSP